jgi:hypothetical protein
VKNASDAKRGAGIAPWSLLLLPKLRSLKIALPCANTPPAVLGPRGGEALLRLTAARGLNAPDSYLKVSTGKEGARGEGGGGDFANGMSVMKRNGEMGIIP